jgi:microcystin-dependent protein
VATPFLGEIKMFAGTFAIQGWAFCDGSILPIAQYDALFALFGTTYGGDGQTTFGLPDLRGRVPVHIGQSLVQGQLAGSESVTLSPTQIPAHGHLVLGAAATGTTANPSGAYLAGTASGNELYTPSTSAPVTLAPNEVAPNGGNQPHDNMMPFTAITFLVALEGIFPSRN